MFQDYVGTLKVALVFEEASRLTGVNETSFNAHDILPPSIWVLDVLLKCVEDLDKTVSLGHVAEPVVEGLAEQEGFVLGI